MRRKNKIVKILCFILGIPVATVAIFAAIGVYLYCTADFMAPAVDIDLDRYALRTDSDSVKICDNATLSLNKYGLWEVKLQGAPIERGAAYGVVCKELLEEQERAFVNQIHRLIPSENWVKFLHELIIIFNRDMAKYIPQEYREEIYAMSLSCTHQYDSYSSPYTRQLNYHAAHDIGHAMQQYMLVGCSSFALWNGESEDNSLVMGRNFDFYVGDEFAQNKVVLMVTPEDGYKFISVSWPGMMGVVSGMNEKGLTVTINASKGAIPISSSMPISLLARHILQYASTISEAYEIARQFNTFVSESLLIGSAKDGYAAIIEKTPLQMALFKAPGNRIICTNHYQSDVFASDEYNLDNIANSDSPYRWERINELLDEYAPIDATDAARVLRNRYGIGGRDIGICNEKSINQFIAHHSVIFKPEELRMWVSTSPWQLGEYVCYDLNQVFESGEFAPSYVMESLVMSEDAAQLENEYARAIAYRKQYLELRQAIDEHKTVDESKIEEFIKNNPAYFQVYNTLGDYMLAIGNTGRAVEYWQSALLLEIPRAEEKEQIIKKINDND